MVQGRRGCVLGHVQDTEFEMGRLGRAREGVGSTTQGGWVWAQVGLRGVGSVGLRGCRLDDAGLGGCGLGYA